jgi:hypothetical protein
VTGPYGYTGYLGYIGQRGDTGLMGPSGSVLGYLGPVGPTGVQKWRLTTTTVTIDAASSEGAANFTDLPVSSTSFVVLAGYAIKQYYVSSLGIRNIYLSRPMTGYWNVTVDLVHYLPYTTIPYCTIVVFALAYVVDDAPTPGFGAGVPTGAIATVVHNS